MSRLIKVFGSTKSEGGKRMIMPHLYLTYMTIGLLASVVHEVFGRDVVVALFSWYYANGLNTYLMGLGVFSYSFRVMLFKYGILK